MRHSRDPFARQELHSKREYNIGIWTCAWCGQLRHTPSGRPFLLRFHIETDGGRTFEGKAEHVFCSNDCRKSYFGL